MSLERSPSGARSATSAGAGMNRAGLAVAKAPMLHDQLRAGRRIAAEVVTLILSSLNRHSLRTIL